MPLPAPQTPHVTERLVLRPFIETDFSAYAAYHGRAEVYRYMFAPTPEGEALERQFAQVRTARFEQEGDFFHLAVVRRADDMLVGEVMLRLAGREARQGEVGYLFNPDHSGQGYATEAVAAIIGIGFSTFGFHRIFARLLGGNTRSIRLLERLGLRREGHFIENDRLDGAWTDELTYAVLAREWAARTG
ncbi:GNAT family N-acetyltransferase [Xanthobacteraceae bacterium A53D]